MSLNIADFKRVISSFADKPTDLDLNKGNLITEIRGELIQAKIITKDGVLFVDEDGVTDTAMNWIKNRIACLPLLAERILDYTSEDNSFVNPSGRLLDELEYDPEEKEVEIEQTIGKLVDVLGRKIPGTTSVVYLTSDAGEGKTTLINHLAIEQAKNFKQKKSDWLLLPIPLGGKPFLRFDDIIIASIVNNLRFRLFYYDSFIELVRLGFIVPAFDGFEEMFMQSSTNEALTATGSLINKLNSAGSVLIAARKAYFDYKSFSSQAKLLDTIHSSVSFARFSIERWNKEQFIEFAEKKNCENAEEIYDVASKKLNGPSHSILTRPVLVKQLIEVFQNINDIEELVANLDSVNDYFPTFVNAIIEREAKFKWIDRSGNSILNVEQHYDLLAFVAEEMWINSSDSLKDSLLEVISEMYSEQNKLDLQIARDVKERIKQHALLIRTDPNNPSFRFDHEEFYEFFLGIAIANNIINNRIYETKSLLKKTSLPFKTVESVVARIKGQSKKHENMISFLDLVTKGENQFSYVKENAGNILIRLLSYESFSHVDIANYELSINSLLAINISNVSFSNCHFQNTSLHASKFINCIFTKCQFDRIEIHDTTSFSSVRFVDCEISIVYDSNKDKGFYEKFLIEQYLKNLSVVFETSREIEQTNETPEIKEDEDLILTEKALRRFIRSNTPINDTIFKMRLGSRADHFFKKILPDLIERKIIIELEYMGHGQMRRFKLGVSFAKIDAAFSSCKGSYISFLGCFNPN